MYSILRPEQRAHRAAGEPETSRAEPELNEPGSIGPSRAGSVLGSARLHHYGGGLSLEEEA
jgi:hypothetical protein